VVENRLTIIEAELIFVKAVGMTDQSETKSYSKPHSNSKIKGVHPQNKHAKLNCKRFLFVTNCINSRQ